MSTKPPLSAVVMELSEQLEARGSWLKLAWVPRQQNEEADALSNEQFDGFDMDKRIHLSPKDVEWNDAQRKRRRREGS